MGIFGLVFCIMKKQGHIVSYKVVMVLQIYEPILPAL